ncbi:MAG: CFI-box-CTERM domain-containing protein [Candidatus Hydrogenedentota bacterium]
MGSRKKLFLSALVSMVVLSSFAIGFLPAHVKDQDHAARAADGSEGVAISVDGQTPVGDEFSIPAGGEQGFSALDLSDGSLLPVGEVDWSLASEGEAELSATPGDLAAQVKALEPGVAGLYLAGAGGSDVVDLTLHELKQADETYMEQVRFVQPGRDSASVFIPDWADGQPFSVQAETDAPDDTDSVQFSRGGEDVVSSEQRPWLGFVPGLTDGATFTITALAESAATYDQVSGDISFRAEASDADASGSGLPDDPFALDMEVGDRWVANLDTEFGGRRVVTARLDVAEGEKQELVEIPTEGVMVALQDPDDPDRAVTVAVPEGLIEEGETAVLVVQAADSAEALVGEDQAALLPDVEHEFVENGQLVELTILVSDDDGASYAPISPERLEGNEVSLVMEGVALAGDENARFLSYPSDVMEVGEGDNGEASIVVEPDGSWNQAGVTSAVDAGVMSAQIYDLSLLAPFLTPADVQITQVENLETGLPQDYSIGGAEIEVTVENLPVDAEPAVYIGDNEAQVVSVEEVPDTQSAVITVVAPEATPLDEPAASVDVDVTVEADDQTDVMQEGFTYVGPEIETIDPSSGTQLGGTNVALVGAGFGALGAVDFNGAPLQNAAAETAQRITGVTSPAEVGSVDVVVTLANNFQGELEGGYTYTPMEPVLTSLDPSRVFSDGGYTLTVGGMGFESPDVDAEIEAYFSVEEGVRDPENDIPAESVNVIKEDQLEVVTPAWDMEDAEEALSSLYVVTTFGDDVFDAPVLQVSNALDLTFVDPESVDMAINEIVPDEGPIGGGDDVEIRGDNLPVGMDDVTTGTVLRVGSSHAQSGETVELPVELFRGDDVILEDPEDDASQAPSTINFRLTYDPEVLSLADGEDAVRLADEVDLWYDHTLQFNEVGPGELNVVIQPTGQRPITTFDQFGDDPTGDQLNPFPLVTAEFEVVGAEGAETPLEVATLSMATPEADEVPNEVGQNGFFNVGAEQETPPSAIVHFGGNEAQVVGTKSLKQDNQTVTVRSPHGDRVGGVDVRVEDPSDATEFAISRATEGEGYEYLEGLAIMDVEPSAGWLFGGQVATIVGLEGEDFGFTDNTEVYFNAPGADEEDAILAERAPADEYPSSSTELPVIVPALEGVTDGGPAEIDATVRVEDGEDAATRQEAYTYVRWTGETVSVSADDGIAEMPAVEGATANTGEVFTTALYFDAVEGAEEREVILTNTPEMTRGSLSIPADEEAFEEFEGEDVYAIARVTREPGLFATQDLTGDAIEDMWNFNVHLYDSVYPFDEREVSFNTAETPASVSYPLGEADVAQEDIEDGFVSTFSLPTDFDYAFGDEEFMAEIAPGRYESNVTIPDFVVEDDEVAEVTSRVFNLDSAFALRTDAPTPEDVREATADESGVPGDTVDITGRGIAWPAEVLFGTGEDLEDPDAYASAEIQNLGEDESLLQVTAPEQPADAGDTVDIVLLFPQVSDDGEKQEGFQVVRIEGGFTYEEPRANLLRVLLGVLASLAALTALGDDDGSDSACFIATAAYGTPMAEDVSVLRSVRDNVLLESSVGTALVDTYYRVSPPIADAVAASPMLASIVRALLTPVVLMSKLVLAMPHFSATLMLLVASAAVGLRLRKHSSKAARKSVR